MKEYALIYKNDTRKEKVAKTEADSKDIAITYFSEIKNLSEDKLKELFLVELIS